MRRFFYILIFAVSLFGFLIAQIPLGFVLDKVGANTAGLSWATARGTLARGDVVGLSFQRSVGPVIAFGSAEMAMKPLALLTGRLAYDAQWAAHSGYANGTLSVSAGQTIRLKDTRATLRIDQLEGLETALRLSGTMLRINVDRIHWHATKGCRSAQGRVSSNWLEVLAGEFGQVWGPISGALQCDGANLQAVLESQSSQGERMEMLITVLQSGVVEVDLQLKDLTDTTTILATSAMPNFETTPDGLRFTYRAGR